MPRYGIRTLLRYQLHSKQSTYILINRSAYYHPYKNLYIPGDGMHFIELNIGNLRYRAWKCHKFNKIEHDEVTWSHNNYSADEEWDLFRIKSAFVTIYLNRGSNKFKIQPTIPHMLPHIQSLNPTNVYDLFRQSISWISDIKV